MLIYAHPDQATLDSAASDRAEGVTRATSIKCPEAMPSSSCEEFDMASDLVLKWSSGDFDP
jgi:hypothetical protein